MRLGEARITPILDGELDIPGDRLFKGLARERWAGWLPDAGHGLVTVPIVVVLVEVDGETVLFDSGLGAERTVARRGGGLSAALAGLGASTATIDRVIISHAHGDHIWGAVTAAGEPAFPNATYHLPRPDWEWLAQSPDNPSTRLLAPLARAGVLVLDEPESQLTPSIRSIDTAGHSPGHRCLLVSSGGRHFCFLGDLTHAPVLHFAEPKRVTDFDFQPALTPSARRRLARQAVAGDWLLGAAHAPFPALGRLTPAGDDSWTWHPVTD